MGKVIPIAALQEVMQHVNELIIYQSIYQKKKHKLWVAMNE